jgi:hypothetical protein
MQARTLVLLLPIKGLTTFARAYGSSSHATRRGVSQGSFGLRFPRKRYVRSTSHSLKFTDAPSSCPLSTGRVPTGIFHDLL